jgi:hypothetical protein
LEEAPTASLQQVFSALPLVSSSSTNKKKKVLHPTVTGSVFHAQLPYSSAPSGVPHLLSNPQLLLNGQPLLLPSLLMLSSNVTHSGLVVPDNAPIHLPSNSVSDQQSVSPTDIVLDIILDGPELTEVFEEGNSFCEDDSLLREFNIKTLD